MDSGWKRPIYGLDQVIEWRARRIADPVERLRFLRRARRVPLCFQHIGRIRRYRWRAIAVVGAFLLLPARALFDLGGAAHIDRILPGPADVSAATAGEFPKVWLVETKDRIEVYSNGLRIENRFAVSSQPRKYKVYQRIREDFEVGEWRSNPAGIVFHATESHLAPFEAEQNRTLKRIGEGLLAYVKQNRSYHFVIDRFGRVFRVVDEGDSANHAGYSLWNSGEETYINLNHSFLGISFEAQTHAEEAQPSATPAQIHSARILTEMLRSKYRIPAANCVTHAQVSVNPGNMLIGYHTDWAANFPFSELGLPDNYQAPLPSLYVFGFGYDPPFVKLTGARLWKGLLLGEEQLRQEATARGLTVYAHRAKLQRKYRQIITALKKSGAEENQANE
ncbi:MAG: N-acetylmuramoyl-L-alanine amidase [Bryobacteraceae bacterium]